MKKLVLAAIPATFVLAAASPVAFAQDAEDPETTETEPNGAIVTREETVEERQAVDEEGNPVTDEAGNPVMETVTTGFVQTVETPSGNVTTITKVEGERAIVTHDRPERMARAERPERAERAERPERPERPEKPERPERPERPGRGG